MINKNNKRRVAVVTQAPFPIGNVSTMRFTSYLKSLVSKDFFTYVLVYCPTRMASDIKESSGLFEGIYYQYATDITWKKYNLFNKIFYLIIGLFKSIVYLNQKKINTVILYGDNLFVVNLFFWFYCKITHKRYIGDRSELPTIEERNSRIKLFVYGLKQRMFDGMIIMTKELMRFYGQYSSNRDFCFFLPMTIDPARFDGLMKEPINNNYIATVFGTHNRDGLDFSILSFNKYCQKGGTFDLYLVGDYQNMPNKLELDKCIFNNSYKDRIHILGKVPNDQVSALLFNASALLTTPNYYVSGGFPTKLGEYMLSGVPIVATKVDVLLDYIEPNVDMLMCEPGNIDAISDALLCVENNPQLSKSLAYNSKKKARSLFCADSYIDQLIVFLVG